MPFGRQTASGHRSASLRFVRGASSPPIAATTPPRPSARPIRARAILAVVLGLCAAASAQVGPPDVIYIYASESAGVIEVAGAPTDIVAEGDRAFALVHDPALDESSLIIIDASAAAESIPLGVGAARGLAITPDRSEAWVSISGADARVQIVSIDPASSTYGTVIETLSIPGATELGRLHVIPQLDAMLVLEPDSERLTIYDRVTRVPVTTIDATGAPLAAAVAMTRNHIYVALDGSDTVRTWDWSVEAWIGTPVTSHPPLADVDAAAVDLVLHEEDTLYWIDSRRAEIGVLGISESGLRFSSKIDTTGGGLTRGVITGDGQHLVVASAETDELLVVDLDTRADTFERVIMEVPTRAAPFGVIRDFQLPDRVIVTEQGTGTISWTRLPLAQTFVRGDCDGDSQVGLGDFVAVLGGLFDPEAGNFFCADACDSNDDGSVDLGDAIFGLQALFVTGSPAIPGPFQDCGLDPTDDVIPCLVSLWCP